MTLNILTATTSLRQEETLPSSAMTSHGTMKASTKKGRSMSRMAPTFSTVDFYGTDTMDTLMKKIADMGIAVDDQQWQVTGFNMF